MSEFTDAAAAAFSLLFDVPVDGVNPLWASLVVMTIAVGLLIVAVVWPLEHRYSRLREHDRELIRRFGAPGGMR